MVISVFVCMCIKLYQLNKMIKQERTPANKNETAISNHGWDLKGGGLQLAWVFLVWLLWILVQDLQVLGGYYLLGHFFVLLS